MTDNEIIKALECCNTNGGCTDCPLFEIKGRNCIVQLDIYAFDLIKRQQAEIERLKEMNAGLALDLLYGVVNKDPELRKEIVAVAITEFAERLKREVDMISYETGFEYQETVETIDNLVKKMTEGNNGNNP